MTIPYGVLTINELLQRLEYSNNPLVQELVKRLNRLIGTIPKQVRDLEKSLELGEMWGELSVAVEKELAKELADSIPDIIAEVIGGNRFLGAKTNAEKKIKKLVTEQYQETILDVLDG